ncbi:hypothetical protein OCU04_004814 [Sclerotinia nivalis]|uniref:N-acetyltransferase domain-containing protein n=1 Tax=Sclerotinia nivalis TaxID=352851 RepID=A0A9X0ARA6_9HELO|nr:hypothetical protein OCU04_004814 [Sclerotinia nivalis]
MAITHPSTPPTTHHTKPTSPPKQTPQITLHPLTQSDLPRLSLLEHLAFEHDEFSDLAFGRERGSPEALQMRSEQFGKFLSRGDCWFVKAVLSNGGKGKGKGKEEKGEEDGGEEYGDEIVGVAGWMSGGGGEGEGSGDGKQEEKEKGKGDEVLEVPEVPEIPKVKTKEELEKIWGKGSNFKLCEDVFVRGDEYMFKACGKERWLKLNILVIHPHYQRHGIGTLLLKQGLQLADSGEAFPPSPTPSSPIQTQTQTQTQPKTPIQVILGASPWGIGLYRKHGFQEVHSMDIRLDLYEGGEGMGSTSHVIMRRAPCCEGVGSGEDGEKGLERA